MTEFPLLLILQALLLSARWTVLLSVVAFVAGGSLGLLVLSARVSPRRAARRTSAVFIDVFQSTPLLMQLFLAYFALALVGVNLPPWLAAGLTLTLWSAAFLAEIWRGCVEAVPRGQWEASASLGFGFAQQLRHVVLPQASRIALAPTVGFMVQVIKATAVTSLIGFVELTKAGNIIANTTLQPFQVYGLVCLMYFCLCWPVSKLTDLLKRRAHGAY